MNEFRTERTIQAQRLRRIGDSRATVRASLSARESASDARRYGAVVVRFR